MPIIERQNDYEGFSASSELRLESSTGKADWVLGVLYARDHQEQLNDIRVSTNPTANWNGYSFLPPFRTGVSLARNAKDFKVEATALFADATFHLNDSLSIFAGGRYTHDKVRNSLNRFGLGPNGSCFPPNMACFFASFVNTPRPEASADTTFDDFSPRLGFRFEASPDLNVYASISKGYKAGGSSVGNNTNAAGSPAFVVPYRKETLWNYEAGVKSELFDRRLRLNGSVFYLDWRDLQLEAFRLLTPGDLSSSFEQTINVRRSRAYGVEGEFLAAVSRRFTLSGGFGYLESEITSDDSAEITGRLRVNLKGLDLPKAPRFTANLAGELAGWPSRRLGARRVRAPRWSIFGSGGPGLEADPRQAHPRQRLPVPASNGFPSATPSYDLLNLRGGFTLDKLDVSLYWQNLTGEKYYTGTKDNFGLSGIRLRSHPMTIGGSVAYKF